MISNIYNILDMSGLKDKNNRLDNALFKLKNKMATFKQRSTKIMINIKEMLAMKVQTQLNTNSMKIGGGYSVPQTDIVKLNINIKILNDDIMHEENTLSKDEIVLPQRISSEISKMILNNDIKQSQIENLILLIKSVLIKLESEGKGNDIKIKLNEVFKKKIDESIQVLDDDSDSDEYVDFGDY